MKKYKFLSMAFIVFMFGCSESNNNSNGRYTVHVSKDAWDTDKKASCSVITNTSNEGWFYVSTDDNEISSLVNLPIEVSDAASFVAREESASCRHYQNGPDQCNATNATKYASFKMQLRVNEGPIREIYINSSRDDPPRLYVNQKSRAEIFNDMTQGGTLHMRATLEYSGIGSGIESLTKKFQTSMPLRDFVDALDAVKKQCPKLLQPELHAR